MKNKTLKVSLRKVHAKGVLKNERADSRDRVWHTLEALGAKTHAERNRLMEARRFARMFSATELNYLCRLGSKNGRPLAWTHVLQLMRIKRPSRRRRLAEKCATYAWTTRELQRQVDCLKWTPKTGRPDKV